MKREFAYLGTVPQLGEVIYSSIPDSRHRHYASVSCPQCGKHKLQRIPRRLLDRFLGLFGTLRRFHCGDRQCNWTGNLTKPR